MTRAEIGAAAMAGDIETIEAADAAGEIDWAEKEPPSEPLVPVAQANSISETLNLVASWAVLPAIFLATYLSDKYPAKPSTESWAALRADVSHADYCRGLSRERLEWALDAQTDADRLHWIAAGQYWTEEGIWWDGVEK